MHKVLIVEDHADIRRLLGMTLEFEPVEVHEAGCAEDGLAPARSLRPDLAMLDVMMPGAISGLDLCRALREDPALHAVPVVMLSARGHASDRQAGLDATAQAAPVLDRVRAEGTVRVCIWPDHYRVTLRRPRN
jgi:DNA-binding response OmpR family regulator